MISGEENNRTKITEISIVACSAAHLAATKMGDLPRVLHKLTLCINPFKRISFKSEDLTRLNNDLLEHEQKFDKNAAETVSHFLSHLQKPCVIVAHNGIQFDFPVLKRMLEMNDTKLTEDLLVVDSLLVFQEIDELEELLVAETSVRPLSPDAKIPLNSIDAGEIKNDEEALDNYISQELQEVAPELKKKASVNDNNLIADFAYTKQLREINETTPVKQIYTSDNIRGQLDARKPSHSKLDIVTPPSSKNSDELFNINKKRLRENPPKSRRDLFGAKKSFKLSQIYERCFDELPQHSHYAENDVITLLKCAIAKKEDFARVVQEKAILFRDIKPLGK